MKSLTILALVTMLALGITLSASAQAQSENPSSDQYTTQSTDQTTTQSTDPTTSMQSTDPTYSNSAAMSTNESFDKDALAARGDRRESQQDIDYLQKLQNDSGAN